MVDYPQFQKDLKKHTLAEALKIHNLTLKDVFDCHQNRQLKNRSNVKYMTKTHNNTYVVRKTINGVKEHYGTYHTEDDAKNVIKELNKCDWDKKQLPYILDKLNIDDTHLKNEYRLLKKNYLNPKK